MKDKGRPQGVRAAGGVLDRIVYAKAERLERADCRVSSYQIKDEALYALAARRVVPFAQAFGNTTGVNVIAEVKHRSPSKGIIREDFDPVRVARSYRDAGAAALSVLCEEDFFGGSLDHLEAIRKEVDLPLLRKDFIFDEYHIYEAARDGADAVLLILAILEDDLLMRLIALSRELGLDTLAEVHSIDEMGQAERAGAKIIGVNNRDLTTFKVDLNVSLELARHAPKDAILVSESGINSAADIQLLRSAGFSAFLIGEHFMRAADPGDALRSLIAGCEINAPT